MKYIAHIRPNDMEEQSVNEHLYKTALLSEQYAKIIDLNYFAKLQGVLHDIGKLTNDFNNYIHNDSNFKRGELDHSFAGAKYLYEYACNHCNFQCQETALMIAHTIISHLRELLKSLVHLI